jgi:hypothetical protein
MFYLVQLSLDVSETISPSSEEVHILFFSSEQTKELVLWGEHGESFDENMVIQKSRGGIVVVIVAGKTATLQKFTGDLSAYISYKKYHYNANFIITAYAIRNDTRIL